MRTLLGLSVALALCLACGGGDAPARPVPAETPLAAPAPEPPAPAASSCVSGCVERRIADAWSSELIAAECAAGCGEGAGLVEIAAEEPRSWVVNGKVDAVDLPWMDREEPTPTFGVHTADGTAVAFACDLAGPAAMGSEAWLTAQRRLDDVDGVVVLADCITPLAAVAR